MEHEMTAPVTAPQGAPEIEDRAAARLARQDAARAAKDARREAARAAVIAQEDADRAAKERRRAEKAERRADSAAMRQARREMRAERAADAASGAGHLVRRAAPAVFAAVPVVMVNGTAFIGQFAYIRDNVPWALPGQVLAAATFESVAVYIAWHAHLAKMKNDSSTRLVIGAQLFAVVMGLMNYSHYSVRWHPTVMAVGLGLMSLLSPLLWGIYSKRASRDKLMEEGLVEPHAVRLGANRWTWHPLRSFDVMWRATWVGEINPKAAIALHDTARSARREIRSARHEARQAEQAARNERRAIERGAPKVARWARHGAPEVPAPRQESGAPAVPAPAQPVAQIPAAPEQPAAQIDCTPVPVLPAPETVKPAPAWMAQYAGAQDVLPGTELNGSPVRAIANLSADPVIGTHAISQAQLAALAELLDATPLAQLPSQRGASDMVCAEHDHRRQTTPVLKARIARGDIPVAPLRALRNTSSMIAVPVSTLPGGKQANG